MRIDLESVCLARCARSDASSDLVLARNASNAGATVIALKATFANTIRNHSAARLRG